MNPTDPPPATSRGLFRRTLRRRWAPILSRWAVLTVALMCAAWFGFKPSYRASSLLRVDPTAVDLYNLNPNGGENLDGFLQTQVQLITSPNVLTAASTNPKVAVLPRISAANDVVAELRKSMTVVVIPGTYLIEVGMATASPVEAATVVNAVVDAYIDANDEWSDGMTRTQIKNLENYLRHLKNQSEELERRWKELAARAELKKEIKADVPGDPDHRRRIMDRQIENELARLQALARREAFRNRPGKGDQAEIDRLDVEIEAAGLLDKALAAKLQSTSDVAGVERMDDVDIAVIQEQRTQLRSMQDTVYRRLEQLRFEAKGEARVRPVNPAIPPGRPVGMGPRPWLMAAIPFLTFLAVLGLFARIEAQSAPAVAPAPAAKPDPAGE